MSRILRRHELVVDDWVTLGEQPPGNTESVIVPFGKFRENREFWLARSGRLGVLLAPADRVEQLTDELSRLALVAVEFPNPSDGRGYTHARLLRERLHFKGELRAVGAGVKQDQVFLLARCGFDSMELAPGENLEEALRALQRYNVAYQPGDPSVTVTRQRFFA